MRSVKEKWSDGLIVSICMSSAFMGLSFLRTWGNLNSALFGGRVIESTLAQPIWGTRLGLRIFGFVLALLAVHFLLALLAWVIAHASRVAFPSVANRLRSWTCLWFLLLAGWVLVANAAWFPHSVLGAPYHGFTTVALGPLRVFDAISALLAVSIIGILAIAANRVIQSDRTRRRAALGFALSVGFIVAIPLFARPIMAARSEMPHVIIIGIDSLRTDYVQADSGLTPAIDDFLSTATVFTDTVTPLARTFPAWVSVVSGRHPHTSGAVINLFPRDLIEEGYTLPEKLRDEGYQTIYAIDEVRFSNLDTSYGFDEMISPPIGSADFLLGHVYDFPLSNLLVNTTIGRSLFPFAYANRAASATYDPATFIARLAAEITFEQPTFLAVHLTLPHWPYSWATSPGVSGGSKAETVRKRYEQSVSRADQQFADIMSLLKQRGALQNALVVVLSDHGESLGEEAGTRRGGSIAGPQFGHGTHVFAMEQYQVLLAMRAFGNDLIDAEHPPRIEVPASLEDIAPTVLEVLGLGAVDSFDGMSLASLLTGEATDSRAWSERVRYLETEYNPPGFSVSGSVTASQLDVAAQTYRVDPDTDRLTIRPEMIDKILQQRQFAALRDESILAALPTQGYEKQFVIYQERGKPPVWLDDEPIATRNAHIAELWGSLVGRFETVGSRSMQRPSAGDNGRLSLNSPGQ